MGDRGEGDVWGKGKGKEKGLHLVASEQREDSRLPGMLAGLGETERWWI